MKISVKLSDVERIVRNAYSMSASDEFELIIDDYSVCSQSAKIWHQVPSDWPNPVFPPGGLLGSEKIIVRFRNGNMDAGIASSWTNNWRQDDNEWDIVEYRIA